MAIVQRIVVATAFICICTASWADGDIIMNGDDSFIAGPQLSQTIETPGDTFIAARTAQVAGVAQGDLHISGFDVSINADTFGDLYALGATVVIRSNVAEDLSAAGFSVRTEQSSQTAGNARLMGHTVTVDGPVNGALSIMGRDVILNAPVLGDVQILAQTLSFGPDAVVTGTLTYSVEDQMPVPERVAPASRVIFEDVSGDMIWEGFEDFRHEMPAFPAVASLLTGFVISLLFFMALGALALGVIPRRLEKLRKGIADTPGQSLLLGVIGLSMLFGMVPILALTIVGLPFAPVVVLGIVIAWIFGYALGAYGVAMRLWAAFKGEAEPNNITRILVFAAAIIAIALLNFIPFVGWVVNYTLVLLGIGAMTNSIFQYLVGDSGAAFDIDLNPIKE